MDPATTWVGVAATAISGVVTMVTVHYRSKTKREIAAIKAGTAQAAAIVANAVSIYHIDTTDLPEERKYELALREISSRDKHRAQLLWVFLAITVLAAIVTVVLALFGHKDDKHADCDDYCSAVEACFPERPKGWCARDCENQVVLSQSAAPGCFAAEQARAHCLMSLSCDDWHREIAQVQAGGPTAAVKCADEEVNINAMCQNTPDADSCRRACSIMTTCEASTGSYSKCVSSCARKFMVDGVAHTKACFLAHIAMNNCVTGLTCDYINRLRESGGRLSDVCVSEAHIFAQACLDEADQDPTRADLGGGSFLYTVADGG